MSEVHFQSSPFNHELTSLSILTLQSRLPPLHNASIPVLKIKFIHEQEQLFSNNSSSLFAMDSFSCKTGAKEVSLHALPRYFALRGSNGKYLGYVRDNRRRGLLSFCYDDLASPCVKHEVVVAENGDAHMKCCYNDKFWRKNSPKEDWIVAAADSPNGDQSSWSSTLFRANIADARAGKISLLLLRGNDNQLGVCEGETAQNKVGMDRCLFASGEFYKRSRGPPHSVAFEAESLVKLPPYVAFKADNDKYLAAAFIEGYQHLSFKTNDIGDDLARQEVVNVHDSQGHVWIKNLYWNQYWELSPNSLWILADNQSISVEDMYMQFLPVQVGATTMALRCRGGAQQFCKRYSDGNKVSCLKEAAWSLERCAIFKVEECVLWRRVSSIKYDMCTAVIYDLEPLVLATSTADNCTDQPATLEMVFSYTDRKSQSWSNSVSFTTGISFEFQVGVPLVVSGDVTISAEVSYSTEWGKSLETETTVGANYHVTVDPHKRVSVDLVATRGKCNVQFAYVQEDLLTSGERVKFSRTDGVFNGMNYTDIKYVAKYVN